MFFRAFIPSKISYLIGASSTPAKKEHDDQQSKNIPAAKTDDKTTPKKAPKATPLPSPKHEYTLEELRNGNTPGHCLVSIFGNVYNLSKFQHPGGERAILGVAGDVADDVFEDGNHRDLKDKVGKMLAKYQVGTLKKS